MSTAAIASETRSLAGLLAQPEIASAELAAHLDALDANARVREIRALSGKLQKRLWHAVADTALFTLEELVPPSVPDGATVIYAGKNSLAMFTHFEKRFTRQGGAVVGYNHQSMSFLTGPGFFTVEPSSERPRELLFDYTRVPSTAPAGWPTIKPNTSGVSKLVYGNLHDFCRRVSRDVIIGSATRLGKDIDSYFLLART